MRLTVIFGFTFSNSMIWLFSRTVRSGAVRLSTILSVTLPPLAPDVPDVPELQPVTVSTVTSPTTPAVDSNFCICRFLTFVGRLLVGLAVRAAWPTRSATCSCSPSRRRTPRPGPGPAADGANPTSVPAPNCRSQTARRPRCTGTRPILRWKLYFECVPGKHYTISEGTCSIYVNLSLISGMVHACRSTSPASKTRSTLPVRQEISSVSSAQERRPLDQRSPVERASLPPPPVCVWTPLNVWDSSQSRGNRNPKGAVERASSRSRAQLDSWQPSTSERITLSSPLPTSQVGSWRRRNCRSSSRRVLTPLSRRCG